MGKKKLSPEELLAQFQEWRASSVEYALLASLKALKAELPQINEITPDITEKWQPFLDEFIKVGPAFKIKGATIKSLLQEQLRTAFFGGVNKRDEPFTIDQFNLDFVNKDTPKNCRHVKNSFVDFLKVVEDVDNQSEETYLDWKKNKVIYKYKEFCKFYKEHMKKDKGHMEAKVLLEKVLFPFKRLMESSARLTLFELGTKSDKAVAESYFQFSADVKSFALNFQEILGTLFTFAKDRVRVNPNVYATFKKLYYPGWENNPVEAHFITPLLESLDLLRVNLFKLYSMGPNFWKQPLADNTVFVDNVVDFLEKETVAEEMLGNILSRAQTNYLYQICLVIHSTQLRDNLVAREKKVIEKTLPQLVVLRSLGHVNKVVNKKMAQLFKQPQEPESKPSEAQAVPEKYSKVFGKVGKPLQFELMNAQQPGKDFTPQSLIPEGYVHQEMVRTPAGVDLELVINENSQDDLDSCGRLLMWSDFLPKEDHSAFIAKARSIRDLNQALLNDLEDFIIVDGMMSSAENYLTDRAAAIEKMNVLNNHILQEKRAGVDKQRPPHLWNDPVTLRANHPLRYSSNSLLEANNPTLRSLYSFVELFADKLKTTNERRWRNLVDRVVDVFSKTESK